MPDFARLRCGGALMAAAGTGAIEIYVGTNLVWKDGVPGPAYAELQCYAKDNEHPGVSDEGRLWTYWLRDGEGGLQPPRGPSCRVVWGTPQNGFALSFNSVPGDAPVSLIVLARSMGRDGWRVTLTGAPGEGSKPIQVGLIPPYIGDVPAGISSISMRGEGMLDIYVRPVGAYGGVFIPGDEVLATSIDLYETDGAFPSSFETLGGNGPEPGGDPTPPLHFWTNLRKCKEIGPGSGAGGGSSPLESAVAVHAPYAATLRAVGAGEIKWFKVTLAAGDYRFHTTDSPDPADYDTHLALFGADGKVIAESDDVDLDNSDYRSSITKALANGTYYVGLTGYGTAFSDGFGAVLDGNAVPAGTIFKIEAA